MSATETVEAAPQDKPDIPPANDYLPIDCGPPTAKEIYQAIKQLKNGKLTRSDRIAAEASCQFSPSRLEVSQLGQGKEGGICLQHTSR